MYYQNQRYLPIFQYSSKDQSRLLILTFSEKKIEARVTSSGNSFFNTDWIYFAPRSVVNTFPLFVLLLNNSKMFASCSLPQVSFPIAASFFSQFFSGGHIFMLGMIYSQQNMIHEKMYDFLLDATFYSINIYIYIYAFQYNLLTRRISTFIMLKYNARI